MKVLFRTLFICLLFANFNASSQVDSTRSPANTNPAETSSTGMLKAGMTYYHDKDYPDAIKKFRMLANKGNVRAEYMMGNCYLSGKGVAQDAGKAVEYYKQAADQGDTLSEVKLGKCYEKGDGVEGNMNHALYWYKLAATQGNTEAENKLGSMYLTGYGVTIDTLEAYRWYRLAADNGSETAKNKLKTIPSHFSSPSVADSAYIATEESPTEESPIDAGVEYFNNKDYVNALKEFQISADEGNEVGEFDMGVVYERQKLYNNALKWYTESAEQGYMDAERTLAVLYDFGRGVVVDHSEAAKWYEKAADQGDLLSEFNLGHDYESGTGVDTDTRKAAMLFQKGVDQGDVDSYCSLGYCYYNGIGVIRDYDRAAELYRKAADQGDVTGEYDLALCYKTGNGTRLDTDKAIFWYKKSAKQDYSYADYYLGEIYAARKEYDAAHEYYSKAVALDSTNWGFIIELITVYNDNKQTPENLKYTKKLVSITDTGTVIGLDNIGYISAYFKQYDKAESYYQRSLKMDTTANNAYYNLACIYSIRKDTAKSLQYLAMSIRHGYDDFEHIKIDTDLDNIRETAGFKELMEKNFPNYYK